jgi:type IV pilus assembly protein PilC
MPDFYCRLATASGKIIERDYTSGSEESLRIELEDKEYLILEMRRKSPILAQIASIFRLKPRVSAREFLFFNQELAALLRAGLPIVQSLDILLERRENKIFRRALVDIRDRVKAGEALSDAFQAQGDLFPPLYCSSLASGERSGEVPQVLRRFIAYAKSIMSVKKKVVSALIYPAILFVLSISLIALMVFFIIPKFTEFLTDFGTDLPLITVVMIGFAEFCTSYWQILLAGVIASSAGMITWGKTSGGRFFFHTVQLRLPVLGGIFRDYAQNRFTRTLATLQSGGIPLVVSLDLAAKAVGNAVYERGLIKVAGKVREGESLWETLDQTGLISGLGVEMVKVGESTGALVEMLNEVSEFLDEEIDHKLDRLVSLIEPVMLLFMALVVGTMLMAVYLPLIEVYGKANM